MNITIFFNFEVDLILIFPGVTLDGWVMVILVICSFLSLLEHYKDYV
jgi:hypothetical protein